MKHFLFFLIVFSCCLNLLAINDEEDEDIVDSEEIAASEQVEEEVKNQEIPPKADIKKINQVNKTESVQKKYEKPLVSFEQSFLIKEYGTLYNNLKQNYVPHKVLSNLANDMEYEEGTSKLFLDAISFLERRSLETLLAYYDERDSKYYKKLVKIIIRKKENRPDIPHARTIDEAIKYVYSKSKSSLREQILLRINKLKTEPTKDLSSYSLDELIREIESRNWNIKLERDPEHLKGKKVPLI